MAAAAAAPTAWIPEDDLLLKNAVEAGASLEALAKGAVPFSRRFTFQELQDRWHLLLYDPAISAQASVQMVHLELSGSSPSLKFNKLDNSKSSKGETEKRKLENIRIQYYSMRKKIRREFFDSSDLGFLAEPSLPDCGRRGGDFEEHVEPQDESCMLGGFISEPFGLQEANLELLCTAFPETMSGIATTSAVDDSGNAFQTSCPNPVEENHANRTLRKDCLYGFHEGISTAVRNEGIHLFDQNIEQRLTPSTTIDETIELEKCLGTDYLGPSEEMTNRKPLGTDDSGTGKMSTFPAMDEGPEIFCSAFAGRHQFNSPDSDAKASFHPIDYPSPLPRLPLWKMMEDISPHAMPVNVSQRDNLQVVEKTSMQPNNDDVKKKSPSANEVVHSGPLLRDGPNSAGLIDSTVASEDELADISDSLLNFSNDDLLFMDDDGKDMLGKSRYDNINSLMLSPPHDIQEDDMCKLDPKILIVSSACPATTSFVDHMDSESILFPGHCDQPTVCHADANVPSKSVLNPDSSGLNHGKIICTLNTEDTEVPCNDDIFLLIHPATSFTHVTDPITIELIRPTSSFIKQSDEKGVKVMVTKEDLEKPFSSSNIKMLPEASSGKPLIGSAESELPHTSCQPIILKHVDKSFIDARQCKTMHETPATIVVGLRGEDARKVELRIKDSITIVEKPQSKVEASSFKMTCAESVMNLSTSSLESESDDDVPYFSDVEAMILDMDLGPSDQDSHVNKQLSTYQHEVSKRTIIRLENCARSSLQRTMSFLGALAILYGRHLKHYIRKAEVTLGRATDEIDVDIDLKREGRPNKISRRQAIIKMETDGSFFIKNLAKIPISVNGKAVVCGQSQTLSSSCLIEIRGMCFVFDVNPRCVKQYLENMAKNSGEKNGKFEWSQEGKP